MRLEGRDRGMRTELMVLVLHAFMFPRDLTCTYPPESPHARGVCGSSKKIGRGGSGGKKIEGKYIFEPFRRDSDK